MDIILLGKTSTITTTLHTMLRSVDEWSIKLYAELQDFDAINEDRADFDLLIANLEDFRRRPTTVVSHIRSHFTGVPLLVVHSYLNNLLIKPLIASGATGYIHNNVSDSKLIEAVQKVASGKECIIAEYT